jgi:SAM-dependent methyltransferase
MSQSQQEIQAAYYTQTAEQYDAMHVSEIDEHAEALRTISGLLANYRWKSVLDVGCGTGRGVKYFRDNHPGVVVKGIEPVKALLDQATQRHNLPGDLLIHGSGDSLPFVDQSIDVVCEFGVLHHVRDPSTVVREMLRVARKAVFISDANRFGQGSMASRWFKLMLYKCGLWNGFNLLKTRGKGYTITEGDGLAYSYSVYDSYAQVARWADRVTLMPSVKTDSPTWLTPLLTSPHVLLCALRLGD